MKTKKNYFLGVVIAAIVLFTAGALHAATANIQVEVDPLGRVIVKGSGTFDACPGQYPQGAGSLELHVDGDIFCVQGCCASGVGSASFSCVQRSYTQVATGTYVYTLLALSCNGTVADSYTLTLDMRPTINSLSPIGNVSTPFTVSANATFKPMGWPDWYGNLSCGVCLTQAACNGGDFYSYKTVSCSSPNCTCEYRNATLPYPYTSGYVFVSTYTGATISSLSQLQQISIVPAQNQSDSEKGNDNACK